MDGEKMRLEQRQRPLFVPLMQQSVKILQLPMLALKERIETELQENPLLEQDEEEEEPIQEEPDQIEEDSGIDWNSYLEGMAVKSPEETKTPLRDEFPNYENIVSQKICLHEYLLNQLHAISLSKKEVAIGEIIIDAIDDDGYLTSSLESIAQFCRVGIGEAEKVLGYIQDLEPVGVGARNLSEALLIQAEYLGLDRDPLFVELIKHHIEEVQRRDYDKIGRALGIKVEDVERLVDRLGSLEPKPGRLYSDVNPVYINPDIIIRDVDGAFVIELNEEWIPRLRISPYYKELLLRDAGDEATIYIKEKMKGALWFLSCIDQRRKTLMQVTDAIFTRQKPFLQSGPVNLVPLRMREVAEMCGVNESTVSRAISSKYAQTPWGIFPLKFFFISGLGKDARREVSSQRIKERMKGLISKENPKRPLSDDDLSEILNQEGLRVARRTIAKYRKQMGILPSNHRKK